MKKGWVEKKLGDVCTLQRGFDLPKGSRTAGDFPLVSSSGVIDTHDIFKVKAPGVATGRSGSIGNVFYIEEDFWPLNTVLYVKDFHGNYARFVYYLLRQFDLGKFSSGVGVPTLNRNFVHDEIVYIPTSISEQQRIVSVLDEAFASSTQAKANAERNLVNARELFDTASNEIISNSNNDWKEMKLGDVCGFIRGPFGGSLKKNVFKSDGYAVYEQRHAIHKDYSEIRYFINEEKFKEMARFELHPGELIMSCSGVTLGRVSVAPENMKPGIINQALLKLTPLNKNISVEFLKLWMESESFQVSIRKYSQGAAIPNVASVKILKDIPIHLPPLAEQRAIVGRLEALSAETKRLEEIYQSKLDALDELRRVLLAKAFEGEL